MNKLLLAGLAVVAFAGVANAETNMCVRPYASLKGTYSKLEMDGRFLDATGTYKTAKTDWVWGGSAAVGLKACAFRTELEYNQNFTTAKDTRMYNPATGDISRGSQNYRSYMLNAYFDVPTHTPFHPYVGAGIGVARVKNRLNILTGPDSVIKDRETNLAYQVMAGIGYNITCNWTLDIGYRWVDNGKSKTAVAFAPAPGAVGTTGTAKFYSTEHQITAGIRYTF